MKTMMRTWMFTGALLFSNLALAQYASGEGPPDETEDAESGPDEATDSEARSLYDAGTAAFSDGRFEDALDRWREAYELSARPKLLYNIATALDRLGRSSEAIEGYASYLEAVPEARNENYVRRRIDVLREQERARAEASLSEDAESAAEPTEQPAVELMGEPGAEPPSRIGPILLFSVAGAAAVAGAAMAFVADDRYDGLSERCPGGECPAGAAGDRDALRRATRSTDALIGAAILSAVAGVVWWVVGSGSERDARVACGIGRCDLRLRF